ncbi:MAG: pyrroline-5-carboxylate reductase [Phycisphaerales bacterium]|nr:pyrroline-5-carboxylate reductase [Phycisphaerales bacterium]
MSDAIAVLGFGTMGCAIVAGMIRSNLVAPQSILVIDPDAHARERASNLGCRVSTDPTSAAECSRFIIAVKPQSFCELALAIGAIQSPTLVISVMAGVSIARVRDAFGPHARCMRCMPNIAAQIGLAATTYAFAAECTEDDRDFVQRLLSSVGTSVEIVENMFNAATAVGGSGPAYLFLLAETMIDSAVRLGFDHATADRLVRQSLLGAATLLARGPRSATELRAMVTSHGGTTSAAMAIFDAHGFRTMMHEALRAANDRGRDLASSAASHHVAQNNAATAPR